MEITPEIVAKVEESIAETTKSFSPFSWPDDACWGEPWAYQLHAEWVTAWNRSGRVEDGALFLRAWMQERLA